MDQEWYRGGIGLIKEWHRSNIGVVQVSFGWHQDPCVGAAAWLKALKALKAPRVLQAEEVSDFLGFLGSSRIQHALIPID